MGASLAVNPGETPLPAGALGVKIAYRRIEAHRLERRRHIVRE